MCDIVTGKLLDAMPDDRIHELKCWYEFYDAIERGEKTFEIRKNDRGYQVGDVLTLQRYNQEEGIYSGAESYWRVTYMTDWEQKPGFVVMGIARL